MFENKLSLHMKISQFRPITSTSAHAIWLSLIHVLTVVYSMRVERKSREIMFTQEENNDTSCVCSVYVCAFILFVFLELYK